MVSVVITVFDDQPLRSASLCSELEDMSPPGAF